MRLHDLRHACATLLLAQGVHPKLVQEALGHSTYPTHHGHVLTRDPAIAAMRLLIEWTRLCLPPTLPPKRRRPVAVMIKLLIRLVPRGGLEPPRPCGLRILSPLRLPISPSGHCRLGAGAEGQSCSALSQYFTTTGSPPTAAVLP